VDNPTKQEILNITRLITEQNYFKFNNRTCTQNNGLAMGAPTSAIFAEIFLQFLENTTIFDILKTMEVIGNYRYVDDILIIYNDNACF
jgi:hypothetical protein